MRWSLTRPAALLLALSSICAAQQSARERLDKIEQELKPEIPKILCVSEKFATAGQPSDAAFSKLAANGFKSVLNMRTAGEGIDLEKERTMVEGAGMRYISIPVVTSAPKPEQVDAFIKAVKDSANQPMLIHCGGANRVGGFWMIYRVVEDNWPEDKALEEAIRIGLSSQGLKTFAHEQIAARKK
ncbi:MAG TPA: protein tyrosine phosphatase family protein [Blastocatellia bacterium]|jgi:uncharacterized protein (TIGR01244 family)|nr:protein tyrosine phosphatase family protein [Blastocatellia bacterium]